MSAHLSEQALIELATGGAGAAAAHVEECASCSARLAELRGALTLAAGAEVPEPPDGYWEAFRRNLGRRIAEEPRRSAWRAWWLAPTAAAAAVALALAVLPIRRPAPTEAPAPARLASWSALPPIDDDDGVPVLEAVVATDEDAAALEDDRGLGSFVAGLSDEESQALAEQLRRQNGGAL